MATGVGRIARLRASLERWAPGLAYRITRRRATRDAREWERSGRPLPAPPLVKQEILRSYVRRYHLSHVVETGTFMGDTVAALAPEVDHVVSIELGRELHLRARERFVRRQNVTVLQGDSANLLPQVAASAPDNTLFWLDAHYSHGVTARSDEDTPILRELETVLARGDRGDVILIDDARMMGEPGWPTLDDIRNCVQRHDANLRFDVADDIIRIYTGRSKRNSPQA